MRIAYVTDAFAVWGGLERVLADKMNYLAESYGVEIRVLTCNQGTHSIPFHLHPNIQCEDLNIRMHQQYEYHGIKRLLIRMQLQRVLKQRMRDAIDRIKPDVIVCVKFVFVELLNQVRGDIPLVIEAHTLCTSYRYEGVGMLQRIQSRSFKKAILLRSITIIV